MDTLNASNNTSRVAEVVSVSPSAEGIITMKVEAGQNNTSAEEILFPRCNENDNKRYTNWFIYAKINTGN